MNKKCALFTPFAALVLAACGQSGQQATAPTQSAASTITAPTTAIATDDARSLDSSVLTAAKPTGQPCSLDSEPQLQLGKSYVFRGWLLDPSRQPAGKFDVALVGNQDFAIAATTGFSRPDVGAYMKDPALAAAGFKFSTTIESVPVGGYEVRLLIKRGADVYACDTGKTLIVGRSAH